MLKAVLAEKNINLFLNYRANGVTMKKGSIESVQAENIETYVTKVFKAPLFADCTDDAIMVL